MNLRRLFWVIVCCCFTSPAFAAMNDQFVVLCYHDVVNNVRGNNISVETDRFVQHLEYLRLHGYNVISIDDLLAAKSGRRPLPEKAVLITVDDAYKSFYQTVFPILKAYGYPVVLAVVGRWIEEWPPKDKYVKDSSGMMTWDEIRELSRSPLVEIASHSYDLHHGVITNPQGNAAPAVITRAYDTQKKSYGSEAELRMRVRNDLERNSALIEKYVGKKPRIMVWPYGAYNQMALEEAQRLGMHITLTLIGGMASLQRLDAINRNLIDIRGQSLGDFALSLQEKFKANEPLRAVQVDLDYIYDVDLKQQERNLDQFLERIKALGVNTVFLQAFSDLDGDGNAEAVYFPNRVMPMRADLFNRVAHQLHTRLGVKVYAWMPVMAWVLPDAKQNDKLCVREAHGDKMRASQETYRRLSPFSAEARALIGQLYADLAANAPLSVSGILFQDDAYLNDFEDLHQEAVAVYEREMKQPFILSEVRNDPAKIAAWTNLKTTKLIEFTNYLAERVRAYNPSVKTARNIYAPLVLTPESEIWWSQSYQKFLKSYDYVVIMAYPFMEGAQDPNKWLDQLVRRARQYDPTLRSTVFKLQAFDWKTSRWLNGEALYRQMRTLKFAGALNIAYYPDDFFNDRPNFRKIRREISMRSYPYTK